ncbi:response regulator [Massilia sp. WF1]|uniref:response regulator n=1 Tax=Massilia sp. WF1 TaxID=1406431 RepID=UPI000A00252B|nr:response regulator [Massilia sp. WF1]
MLESMGCNVETAYHPDVALSKSQEKTFDFFVLDIGLPDMNGYELVEALRKNKKNETATFLAFSAYGDKAYSEKSLASGSNTTLSNRQISTKS